MSKLFGTDGIRGKADRYPLDGATLHSIGQAVSRFFARPPSRPRVIIGRDTRISGDRIEDALVRGITSAGGFPSPVGVLPTPGVGSGSRLRRVFSVEPWPGLRLLLPCPSSYRTRWL